MYNIATALTNQAKKIRHTQWHTHSRTYWSIIYRFLFLNFISIFQVYFYFYFSTLFLFSFWNFLKKKFSFIFLLKFLFYSQSLFLFLNFIFIFQLYFHFLFLFSNFIFIFHKLKYVIYRIVLSYITAYTISHTISYITSYMASYLISIMLNSKIIVLPIRENRENISNTPMHIHTHAHTHANALHYYIDARSEYCMQGWAWTLVLIAIKINQKKGGEGEAQLPSKCKKNHFLKEMVLPKVKENDSNDTLVLDDDAHKVNLRARSYLFCMS